MIILQELDAYFSSYGDLDVQKIMLEDEPRLSIYKEAIVRSRERIQGKIVLDVGSGTGILSIFCAQLGAKHVHAVEASRMADFSKEVIKENKAVSMITVHNCLVKDLELPEKVDVIVSEWMGFYLFHEGMLEAVIEARDRFLNPDGLIIPESADLYVAPCELPRYFDFWSDVHGVKMNCLGKFYRATKKEPLVTRVRGDELIAEESVVKSVFLESVTLEELQEFSFKTVVTAKRDAKFQGLCLWFVCNFSTDENEIIFLNTHPNEADTHWRQTAIVFPFEIPVSKNDPLSFSMSFRKRKNDSRKYVIEVTMLDPEKEEHPVPCECNLPKCLVISKYMEETMKKS